MPADCNSVQLAAWAVRALALTGVKILVELVQTEDERCVCRTHMQMLS